MTTHTNSIVYLIIPGVDIGIHKKLRWTCAGKYLYKKNNYKIIIIPSSIPLCRLDKGQSESITLYANMPLFPRASFRLCQSSPPSSETSRDCNEPL